MDFKYDIRLSPIVENNELTHINPTYYLSDVTLSFCNLLNILYTVAPMISCLYIKCQTRLLHVYKSTI